MSRKLRIFVYLKCQVIQAEKSRAEIVFVLEKFAPSEVTQRYQTISRVKKRSHKLHKILDGDFIRAQQFLRATFSVFHVFRSFFYNLKMTYRLNIYSFRNSHQEVFFWTSAVKIWGKCLKVTGEGVRSFKKQRKFVFQSSCRFYGTQ